jgi:hypothetical protein
LKFLLPPPLRGRIGEGGPEIRDTEVRSREEGALPDF